MRTYLTLAACVAVAVFFVAFRAGAQTLEGTHFARIVQIDPDVDVADDVWTGVMITPHLIGYSRLCAGVAIGRDGNRLGVEIDPKHFLPQPAIHCSAYPQDVAMFSALTAGADEMRFDEALGLVSIFAKNKQLMVLELND